MISRLRNISLNHFYVVAGPKTFNAFKKSPLFTKQLARAEHKVNAAEGLGQWEGLYVRGRNTYLEIFEKLHGHQVGDYGIGFGVEQIGALNRLFPSIKARYPQAAQGQFKRPSDTHPLFDYIQLPKITSAQTSHAIDPFLIEYTVNTFKIKHSVGDFPNDDISRRRYNSGDWDPNAHLEDITGISLGLESKMADELSDMMSVLNIPKTSDNPLCFFGQDFGIKLIKLRTPQPLNLAINMRLQRPLPNAGPHDFDGAELTSNNNTATLRFGRKA